jgi:hypothetical protein
VQYDVINTGTARSFGALHPNGLDMQCATRAVHHITLGALFRDPGTGDATGAPYVTMPLTPGIEMHYLPGDAGDFNLLATALATHHAYAETPITGPVYFTGDSADQDTAPGMSPQAADTLNRTTAHLASLLGMNSAMLHEAPMAHRAQAQNDTARDVFGLLIDATVFGGHRA